MRTGGTVGDAGSMSCVDRVTTCASDAEWGRSIALRSWGERSTRSEGPTFDDADVASSDQTDPTREGSVAQRSMSEAEQRYVEAVADDCRRILGPGVELVDLEIKEGAGRTTMTVTYRLDGWEGVSSAGDDSLVGAHAALREALVVDRLKLGFAIATDPRALA
jgi:hypothetical protein